MSGEVKVRVMDGSAEDQMRVRWSGEVRVKSHNYSELDIGGRETCSLLSLSERETITHQRRQLQ